MDRRALLKMAGVAAAGGGAGWYQGRRGLDEAVVEARFHPDNIMGQGEAERAVWYRQKFIGQPVMDVQLMFWLGAVATGLTDIGEVLDTASRITAGDETSWFEQWRATAARIEAYAATSMAKGHAQSAASFLLRAGAYYRAGLMRYARRDDPRIVADTKATLSCHDRALPLLGYDTQAFDIPYGESMLSGRVYFAPPGKRRNVYLLLHQGLHAWPEDTKWVYDGALARGYDVLSFHGPGQGASLRLHGHTFRPDWEVPVGAALDAADKHERLHGKRAVLMGLSFGGYLAPRAAAEEPRLAGLIANPGVLSWADAMLRHFRDMPGLMKVHAQGPTVFNRAIDVAALAIPDARWYFDDTTWKHGVASPHALVDELHKYDAPKRIAKIRCKTLIMDGTAEDASPGEAQRLYDALTCPKTMMRFDASTTAQTHCQGNATLYAQARLFDWLDEEVRS